MMLDGFEAIIRRAMQKYNAFTDPFSLASLATLLKPVAGLSLEDIRSDERASLQLESAIEYLELLYRKAGVEDPRATAEAVILEVLEACKAERRLCS